MHGVEAIVKFLATLLEKKEKRASLLDCVSRLSFGRIIKMRFNFQWIVFNIKV